MNIERSRQDLDTGTKVKDSLRYQMNLKEERNAQQTVGFLEVDEEMTDGFNREEKASTRSRQVCCAIFVALSCLLPPPSQKNLF